VIRATHLENGSFLQAFCKAEETLRLHPWHVTEENNIENSQRSWFALKKIFLVVLRHFLGLLTAESTEVTALLPSVISNLAGMTRKSISVKFYRKKGRLTLLLLSPSSTPRIYLKYSCTRRCGTRFTKKDSGTGFDLHCCRSQSTAKSLSNVSRPSKRAVY
jgi:hypothetical protein